jgi:hypothetical protein
MLEPGSYSCEAYFREVMVNDIDFNVLKETNITLTCQLTTLIFTVLNEQSIPIPFTSIELNYNYTSDLNPNDVLNNTEIGETNIAGVLQLDFILPNISYEINSSRHGNVFSNYIFTVPKDEFVNVTLNCPTMSLSIIIVDSNDVPISDVNIEAKESMGGLIYKGITDINGEAFLNCTFGSYLLTFFKDDFIKNETSIALFENTYEKIYLKESRLLLTVKVVDYLNQPIIANVTLKRGSNYFSGLTHTDGSIMFDRLTYGNWDLRIGFTDSQDSFFTRYIKLEESGEINIKLEKYVVIMGMFVETNLLITLILIAIILLFVLIVEKYREKIGKLAKRFISNF